MSDSFDQVNLVVRTIAQTAVDNERYFGDLDAVVGDGDFGYSMARGFEQVLAGFDDFDRSDVGTFLKKVAVTITGRIGGTSGPIWGTAFLRAGAVAAGKTALEPADVVAMLRAAVEGIKRAARPSWATRHCWTPWSRPPTRSSASWTPAAGAPRPSRRRRPPPGRRPKRPRTWSPAGAAPPTRASAAVARSTPAPRPSR